MNFTVYSKEGCDYCERIKTVLRLTGSTYVVYNLGEDFTKEEFIAEFGEGATFPQVSCDGKKLGGSVETVKFLREQQRVACSTKYFQHPFRSRGGTHLKGR